MAATPNAWSPSSTTWAATTRGRSAAAPCSTPPSPTSSSTSSTTRARSRPPSRPAAPRRAALSPYRVYNTLTFGVRGTAMASFEALSPAERWALAFYVMRLGHEGEPARGPVALSLGEQAARTDGEVVDALRAAGARDLPEALAWVRTEGAFQEPAAATALERTRAMLREAVARFDDGHPREADRRVLDAYLEGFEPLEPRLRARDAQTTAAVEGGFRELRAALQRG